MSWGSTIKSQLRSVIEWQAKEDSLFEVWSTTADEIKNASKLILKPGQGCIFLYEGKVQAVWTTPNVYELKTANIPFWTTITKFMQAFVSEHKVGIYFFRTAEIVNVRWGTPTPITYQDPKFNFPVKLKCHGTFAAKIANPELYLTNVVMARPTYNVEQFKELMLGRLLGPMGDYLAESGFSYAEVDKNRNEVASGLMTSFQGIAEKMGFDLTDFRITGTGFDGDTERRIAQISDAHVEAQVAAARGVSVLQQEQLNILKTAAGNEGGGIAATGAGLTAGMAMGQMMGQMVTTPVASAGSADDPMVKLQKLKSMLGAGLITQEDFETKKKDILSKI
jgi:membrane protease subunit (stomatin/prohibitin family)